MPAAGPPAIEMARTLLFNVPVSRIPHREAAMCLSGSAVPAVAAVLLAALLCAGCTAIGREAHERRPEAGRDPGLWPYAVTSVWNTPIGSGARWSGMSGADTQQLIHANGFVNSGQWSSPFFFGRQTDPV